MKPYVFILLLSGLFIAGCKKNCWHCTAITEYVWLFTKGTDTVKILFVEGSHSSMDALTQQGYRGYQTGEVEYLPIDYSYCDGGDYVAPYIKCSRVK